MINPEGIDIPALDKHVAVNRKVVGFKGGDAGTNEQLLTMPVDVLIPAALGGVFDATMARAVQAKVIIEAANSPTWPEADEVFRARGIPVVPDILANAGGVIVSYFEWVQNLQHFRWPLEQIQREEESRLVEGFAKVYDLAQRKSISLRTAAFMLAISRVGRAASWAGSDRSDAARPSSAPAASSTRPRYHLNIGPPMSATTTRSTRIPWSPATPAGRWPSSGRRSGSSRPGGGSGSRWPRPSARSG